MPQILLRTSLFQGAMHMSKSQDTKKDVKKQPTKTMKEKKAAKKLKKEESKRKTAG